MMTEVAAKLRERIAEARVTASLTQAAVEEKLGLPPGAVSKIESGAREISSTELAALATMCGKRIGWFFSDGTEAAVHFRGEIGDDESRRDLAWFSEFAAAYRSLRHRVDRIERSAS